MELEILLDSIKTLQIPVKIKIKKSDINHYYHLLEKEAVENNDGIRLKELALARVMLLHHLNKINKTYLNPNNINEEVIKEERPSRISLPKYSLGEELVSSISHGFGALLAIVALIVGLVVSVQNNKEFAIVSMSIYGSTMILLYTISTIYHALRPNMGKRVIRVLDHCSIFLLIAGTYTPFSLVSLSKPLGWIVFGVVWTAAALGITLNAIDIKKFSKISMVLYLASGWMIVFAFEPLIKAIGSGGTLLLILGGVAYTVGAVLYGVGKKKKYIHSVWHFFVLLGSIFHYFAILNHVL